MILCALYLDYGGWNIKLAYRMPGLRNIPFWGTDSVVRESFDNAVAQLLVGNPNLGL